MKFHEIKKIMITGVFIFLSFLSPDNFAQTTGKIVGKIVDAETGDPIPGAQIILTAIWFEDIEVDMDSKMGALSDLNGDYYIINVTPGSYTLLVRMMGYENAKVEKVPVSVNRSTHIDVEIRETSIEGEEVIVSASKLSTKKDLTGSIKNVSSDQMNSLPVEDVNDVIEMQAGIVNNHFRGGRSTEVSYMIDGVQVDEGFYREGQTVELEKEAVQDLEVITGTFNAEYGRAMSGIVNLVTKDGGNDYHGSITGYLSNYYTGNSDVFMGIKSSDIFRNQDYKAQLEGPILKNKITFFTNIRVLDEKGHLNGIRRFSVDDYSNFDRTGLSGEEIQSRWDVNIDGKTYYSEHTGDHSYVAMNTNKNLTFTGKLTFNLIKNLKFSLFYTKNDREWMNYSHYYKYNPDSRVTYYEESDFILVNLNHMISTSAFHDLKISYTENWYGSYLYENPFDSRYVADNYNGSNAGGFSAGGQDKSHEERTLIDLNLRYDLTWQINKTHSLKTGVVYTEHEIQNEPVLTRDKKYGSSEGSWFDYDIENDKIVFNPYEPELMPDSSLGMDIYNKKPYEWSLYLQDKMEFNEMVINLGIRYDYFNANTVYPSQLRNPANQLRFPDNPERMSQYPKADAQAQISPRFGLSYTLGDRAVLHFSYGHFFQMPPLYSLYQNHRFLIPTGDFSTVHGNPNIKAEKTVQYEVGLWQEILPGMGCEISVFYRDIYDLQSAVVITTYNQIKYGLFSNKDYGNVKGLEFKFDYRTGPISLMMNYTFQYTRGIADNPNSTFNRLGQNIDPISVMVPMPWDQRHTFNLSVSYDQRNYGATLTGYYNSGLAYTYKPIDKSPLSKQKLLPYNSYKPGTITLDFKSHYDFRLSGTKKLRFLFSVYNLLDRLNEISVHESTGRAYTSIIHPSDYATFRSNFNTIYDKSQDPSMYSAPREVKIGLGFVF